jgi:hypothetical protein
LEGFTAIGDPTAYTEAVLLVGLDGLNGGSFDTHQTVGVLRI